MESSCSVTEYDTIISYYDVTRVHEGACVESESFETYSPVGV